MPAVLVDPAAALGVRLYWVCSGAAALARAENLIQVKRENGLPAFLAMRAANA